MAHPYISSTTEDVDSMLETIDVPDVNYLFSDIPPKHQNPDLVLPPPLSEQELVRTVTEIAAKNTPVSVSFLGAGVFTHHLPAVVVDIISRGEYFTRYTPYQLAISKGTLQTTWYFNTLLCAVQVM